MKLELIATATFGIEAVVKREIENLGYRIIKSEDAKITYMGDERAIVRSNLWLRCADRVLVKMAEFTALEFEELFQQVKGIAWEEWIPIDGKFTVTGSSVKSKLSSVPACQRIVKKAVASRLSEVYGLDILPETGAEHEVKVTLLKDRATITLDTTGAGLHKRGYRVSTVDAPIKETLAAAMVQLSFWNKDRILVDPCCGSGTIPIEAAMIGRNIAPGLGRKFVSEEWEAIPKELWREERRIAYDSIDYDAKLRIFGSDIDGKAVSAARRNAEEAGVDDCIAIKRLDIADFTARTAADAFYSAGMITSEANDDELVSGVFVSNPPYGERIGEAKAIKAIYKAYNKFLNENPTWSLFMVTTDKEAEDRIFGRPADRRRKLYNGRLEVCYYQFHGQRPPKKNDANKK